MPSHLSSPLSTSVFPIEIALSELGGLLFFSKLVIDSIDLAEESGRNDKGGRCLCLATTTELSMLAVFPPNETLRLSVPTAAKCTVVDRSLEDVSLVRIQSELRERVFFLATMPPPMRFFSILPSPRRRLVTVPCVRTVISS